MSRLLVVRQAHHERCATRSRTHRTTPKIILKAKGTSGPSTLNKDQIAERGAQMARRDDREYREYLREEQRRQPRGPQRGTRVGVEEGCPARKMSTNLQRGTLASCA